MSNEKNADEVSRASDCSLIAPRVDLETLTDVHIGTPELSFRSRNEHERKRILGILSQAVLLMDLIYERYGTVQIHMEAVAASEIDTRVVFKHDGVIRDRCSSEAELQPS
ncbi:MAG TPA: hypothetical protein VMM76_10740 [Pirellulaceae bacterium]|nr:hypothetical protein [Pirellulaceae bacterium]